MNDLTRRGFIFTSAAIASYGLLVGVQRVCLAAFSGDESVPLESGPVKIAEFADDGSPLGVKGVPRIRHADAEWKQLLTPGEYQVMRHAATEFAYSGPLDAEHRSGLYRCAGCRNALFDSSAKFDSGTGWPSFWKPIAPENLFEKTDMSLGVLRREVKCALCDAHLGHVFSDGPDPTGLRYCMNSVAMRFLPRPVKLG